MTKEELINLRNTLIDKMNSIKNWFRNTDYIELQASRGTIARDSEKYVAYLEAYNLNLVEFKKLREEFRDTTLKLQELEVEEG